MTHTPKTAKLEFNGKVYELPVITGSQGEMGLDIRQLRAQTGLLTYDPGFVNTASCGFKRIVIRNIKFSIT